MLYKYKYEKIPIPKSSPRRRSGKILWWSDVVCSIQRHVLHPPTSLSLTDLSPQSPQSKDRLTISQSHNLKIGLQSHNLQSKDRLTTTQSKYRLTITQSIDTL